MAMRGSVFSVLIGLAGAAFAAVPMPATTPEEIIALAHRTYDYVARSVPEKELAALKDELAIDEKWYADAKKANDAREMRNATRCQTIARRVPRARARFARQLPVARHRRHVRPPSGGRLRMQQLLGAARRLQSSAVRTMTAVTRD